jgi:hypothetical protein
MSKAQDMVTDLRGWGALNLDNQAYKDLNIEQQAQIMSINSDMRELFMDSELGQRVLGVLIDWTVRQPVARPEYSSEMAYFREGQNDIVRCILSACHNSEEGKK